MDLTREPTATNMGVSKQETHFSTDLLPDEEMTGPQTDYFSDIAPCAHLKSVLKSLARDEVFSTYRLAARVSQRLLSTARYRQRKDGSRVPYNKLMELKNTALRCTECSLTNFHHNMACLQCPHVGCINGHRHSYTHYKLLSHMFAIDISNGLLFCFLCGDYVNDDTLDRIRLEVTYGPSFQVSGSAHVSGDQGARLTTGAHISDADPDAYADPAAPAVAGIRGFVNLGATCYMSCILQTLVHNPLVKYRFFNNDHHYFNCDRNRLYLASGTQSEDTACVTCALDHIFKSFYVGGSGQGFCMSGFLATAWHKKRSFLGAQEQDAHEFWQFVMNELHHDHERVCGAPAAPETCTCMAHSVFAGELVSSIRCESCGSVTAKVDPMLDLSLEVELPGQNTTELDVNGCLDMFTLEEPLDALYSCQHCQQEATAYKTLHMGRCPAVLSIQLKRFKHNLAADSFLKIDTPVAAPMFLDMAPYTTSSSRADAGASPTTYELFAVVSHIGSFSTGHYVVAIKTPAGQWLKFDDSVVSLVSPSDVAAMNAYLLFYMVHAL